MALKTVTQKKSLEADQSHYDFGGQIQWPSQGWSFGVDGD